MDQGIMISQPEISTAGASVQDDVIADRVTYLDKQGRQQGLGHMYTNPVSGKVRLTVLSQGGKPELVQLPFPDRTSALRFLAANGGPARREAMLGADRLKALQRAQEISMGQTVDSVLLYND